MGGTALCSVNLQTDDPIYPLNLQTVETMSTVVDAESASTPLHVHIEHESVASGLLCMTLITGVESIVMVARILWRDLYWHPD